MNLQQLTIDEVLHSGYSFELQSDSGVYPKIDWLTLMFHDCTLNDVLFYLNQSDYLYDFVGSMYEKAGIQDNFVFVFNYIRVEIAKFYFYQQSPDTPVFDFVVPSIRVDLSGKALDYLRSCDWDFYMLRLVPTDLSFHVTRCDWAFDFVDYKADFMDRFIDHLQTHQLPSGRIPLISTHGAVKYSLKLGSEKTVYLGATKSDKLLRIYDKRMQYVDSDTGIWKEEIPFDDPSSWFRIELQTRNQTAHGLLMPGVNGVYRCYDDILKYIFESYAFADGVSESRNCARTVVDFWNDLFPWQEVSAKIIQNANYVQPKPYEEKLKNYVDRIVVPKIIEYIHKFGVDEFERVCQRYIDNLSPFNDQRDPSAYKRRMALLAHLVQLGAPVPEGSKDCNGLYQISGVLKWIYPSRR